MREDQEQLVGHLMRVATIVAMQEGLDPGYRIVINDGADARVFLDGRLICRANCFPPSYSCDWWKEVWLASSLITFVSNLFV